MKTLTLTPAYGRDYKSKKEVLADWNANKDFIIANIMNPYNDKLCNKSDALILEVTHINIRYKNLTQIAVIKL